ncbi:MAG: DUF2237 domain-containing protein [Planctomycetota bacterium]
MIQQQTPHILRGRNVLGGPLQDCSHEPLTGFFRDGCCRTDDEDHGSHTVCAVMTEAFLAFTRSRGNDLSTAHPPYFPGLKAGDRWCLCAARWLEAYEANCAPPVVLEATSEAALRVVSRETLEGYAIE